MLSTLSVLLLSPPQTRRCCEPNVYTGKQEHRVLRQFAHGRKGEAPSNPEPDSRCPPSRLYGWNSLRLPRLVLNNLTQVILLPHSLSSFHCSLAFHFSLGTHVAQASTSSGTESDYYDSSIRLRFTVYLKCPPNWSVLASED